MFGIDASSRGAENIHNNTNQARNSPEVICRELYALICDAEVSRDLFQRFPPRTNWSTISTP